MLSSVFLSVLLCVWTANVWADSLSKPQQLENVRQSIQSLQSQIDKNRSQYGHLHRQLQDEERHIGRLAASLESLAAELKAKQRRHQQLSAEHAEQAILLQAQRQNLAQQIRAAYIMGRQDYLKILLNQEDPAKVGRTLTYYDYFNRARVQRINNISDTLERLEILDLDIQQETQAISLLQTTQQAQKQELETSNQERRKILRQLDSTYANQSQRLKELQDDERNLRQWLQQVESLNLPQNADVVPFLQLKKQLPWPLKGKILHKFGDERGVGSLQWQGLLIAAKTGAKVRAIATGRVVFADWFRNFGQLLIIEHDNAHMSLYGHNQSLYKTVGDLVKSGDVVASVGRSGGQQQAALYFELRKQGTPLNPLAWLSK